MLGLTPVYDKETGRLQRLDFDSDKDGRIDTVSFMDGQKVIRIEIDKDQDGRVERWEYYGAEQTLERVGFSRSNDGKEDAWSYQGPDGAVARIDVSVNRDGKVNRREFYEKRTAGPRRRSRGSRSRRQARPSAEAQTWKPARWETYDRQAGSPWSPSTAPAAARPTVAWCTALPARPASSSTPTATATSSSPGRG